MTQFRPTDEQYDAVMKEVAEIKERNKEYDWLNDLAAKTEHYKRVGEAQKTFSPALADITFDTPGDDNLNPNGNDRIGKSGSGDDSGGKRQRNEVLDAYYRKLMSENKFKTFADSEEILWFDSSCGVYRVNGKVKIKTELEKIFREELKGGLISIANLLREHDREEIINRIKWSTTIDREEFDVGHSDFINVQNGLLCIRCRYKKLHTPEFLSTKQFPIAYDPKASWVPILKFLKQIQNREGVKTLLKMFGYILMTNTVKYQKAFFFVGRGDNGKSVLMDLITAFVGKDNCSNVKLHDLKNDRFMAAQMYGKIINAYADIPGTNIADVGLFKALVSGDKVTAQHKYGKLFSFGNNSKMIYSGNKIPLSDGEDDLAYFKRWVILKFDAFFKEEQQDKDLIKKLTTPENLSGLLNLALVGLMLLEREGFENVPIEVIREEYDRESHSLRAFIEDECTINLSKKEYYMIEDDFNRDYLVHHERMKQKMLGAYEEPLSPGQVEIELAKYKVFKKRIQINKIKKYCYTGIITKEEAAKRNQEILERQRQNTLQLESTR